MSKKELIKKKKLKKNSQHLKQLTQAGMSSDAVDVRFEAMETQLKQQAARHEETNRVLAELLEHVAQKHGDLDSAAESLASRLDMLEERVAAGAKKNDERIDRITHLLDLVADREQLADMRTSLDEKTSALEARIDGTPSQSDLEEVRNSIDSRLSVIEKRIRQEASKAAEARNIIASLFEQTAGKEELKQISELLESTAGELAVLKAALKSSGDATDTGLKELLGKINLESASSG